MDRGSGTLSKQLADFVIVCFIRQYTRAIARITRLLYLLKVLKVRLQYIEVALSCKAEFIVYPWIPLAQIPRGIYGSDLILESLLAA